MASGAVFEQKAGWQGARRENTLYGSSTEEQRRQPAFCSKTLRAAGLLKRGFVVAGVTARYGEWPVRLARRQLRLAPFQNPSPQHLSPFSDRLLEQLAVFEEPFEFDGSGFGRVGGVANIDHHIDAEIAANCSLGGFFGIRRSKQITHASYRIFTFEREGDDRGALHELLHFRKERLLRNVRVVFAKQGIFKAKHFDPAKAEASGFEAGRYGADVALLESVGFEQNERGFQ